MVVKPSEIVNWEGVGAKIENEIDGMLKTRWRGKTPVRVSLSPDLPERIVEELIRRYQAAGWGVRHEQGSDQREGSWSFLEFRE